MGLTRWARLTLIRSVSAELKTLDPYPYAAYPAVIALLRALHEFACPSSRVKTEDGFRTSFQFFSLSISDSGSSSLVVPFT